jgi:hypothetical protein
MSPREMISPQLELGTDPPTDVFDRPTHLIGQIQRDEAALSRSKRSKSTRFDQKNNQFHRKNDRFDRKNSRFDRVQVSFDQSEIQTTDPSATIVNPLWFVMH